MPRSFTGVDQHGQKVQQAAQREGIPAEEFVDQTTEKFLALWKKLDLSYDTWAATTSPLHKPKQRFFRHSTKGGELYKERPTAASTACARNSFLPTRSVDPMAPLAPEWGAKLSNSRRKIGISGSRNTALGCLGFLGAHTTCVSPAFRQQELRNAVEKLSGDLSIFAPKVASRLGDRAAI